MLRRTAILFYGGKTNFVPMNLHAFIELLKHAKDNGGILSEQIFRFLKWADSKTDTNDEVEWFATIENASDNWVEVSV